MSTTYTGVPGNISAGAAAAITQPSDGDAQNVASVDAALQALTDFMELVQEQACLAALMDMTPLTFAASFNGLCATNFAQTSAVQLVTVGAAGAIETYHGILGTGQSRTSGVSAALNAVASNGSLLVAVGAAVTSVSTILTSSDGITWTSRTNPGTGDLDQIVWCSGLSLWVAAGPSQTVLTSPDGITWTARTLTSYANGGGLYTNGSTLVIFNTSSLFGGGVYTTTYWTSTNGTSWTSRTIVGSSTAQYSRGGVIYSSLLSLWVLSLNGNAYTSPDLITWTSRSSNGPQSLFQVGRALAGVLPGGSNTNASAISTSFDAITWKTRLPNTGSADLASALYKAAATMPNGAVILYTGGGTAGVMTAPFPTP